MSSPISTCLQRIDLKVRRIVLCLSPVKIMRSGLKFLAEIKFH